MTALERPFSYSQLSTFLRCEKAHDYSYKQGLRSLRPSVALQLGSLVDAGLTYALEGRHAASCQFLSQSGVLTAYNKWAAREDIAPLLELSDQMREESDKARDDAILIAARAIRDLELDTNRWETLRDKDGTLAVQYEIKAPLKHHKPGYTGFVDWIAKDTRTGHVWLIDFKVRKSFDSEEMIQFDYQLSSYQHAAEDMFDETFTGVALYQIKSKVPEARILKNGKLSTAAQQSCDWETYSAQAQSMGLVPASYEPMREKLPKFQDFTWTIRSEQELANIWKQVETGAWAMRMAHQHEDIVALRVLQSKTCSWCDYKDLCLGELRGHDVEFIKQEGFSVRE